MNRKADSHTHLDRNHNLNDGWFLHHMSIINWGGVVRFDLDMSYGSFLLTAPNGTGKTSLVELYSLLTECGKSQFIQDDPDRGRTIASYVLGATQKSIERDQAVSYGAATFKKKSSESLLEDEYVSIVMRFEAELNEDTGKPELLNSTGCVVPFPVHVRDFLDNESTPLDEERFCSHLNRKYKKLYRTEINGIRFRHGFHGSGNSDSTKRSELAKSLYGCMGMNIESGTVSKLRRAQRRNNALIVQKIGDDLNKGTYENFIRKNLIDDVSINMDEERKLFSELRERRHRENTYNDFVRHLKSYKESTKTILAANAEEKRLSGISYISKNVALVRKIAEAIHEHEALTSRKKILDGRIDTSEKELQSINDNIKALENNEQQRLVRERKKERDALAKQREKALSDAEVLKGRIETDNDILAAYGLGSHETVTREAIISKQDDLSNSSFETRKEAQDNDEALRTVSDALRNLRAGQRISEERYEEAKRLVELCRNHHDIELHILCELVDSVDEDYKLAIETELGHDRFALIPDTMEDYRIATRLSGTRHKVIYPKTGDGCNRGSVAEHVSSHHAVADSYLKYRLGRIMVMHDFRERDVNDNSISLTPDSRNGLLFRFRGRGMTKMQPVDSSRFMLGQMSRQEREENIVRKQEEFEKLRKRGEFLKNRIRQIESAQNALYALDVEAPGRFHEISEALQGMEKQISTLEQDIKTLEADSETSRRVNELEKRKEVLRKAYSQQRYDHGECIKEIGAQEREVRNLRDRFHELISPRITDGDSLVRMKKEPDSFEKEYLKDNQESFMSQSAIETAFRKNEETRESASKQQHSAMRSIDRIVINNRDRYPDLGQWNDIPSSISAGNDAELADIVSVVQGVLDSIDEANRKLTDAHESLEELEDKKKVELLERFVKLSSDIMDGIERDIKLTSSAIRGIKLHNWEFDLRIDPRGGEFITDGKKLGFRYGELVDFIKRRVDPRYEARDEDRRIVDALTAALLRIDDKGSELYNPASWLNYRYRYQIINDMDADIRTDEEASCRRSSWRDVINIKKTGSGGQEKATIYVLIIAAALKASRIAGGAVSGIKTIFMDEAFNSIDTKNAGALVDMVRRAGLQGVYMTHAADGFCKGHVDLIIRMRKIDPDKSPVAFHYEWEHDEYLKKAAPL